MDCPTCDRTLSTEQGMRQHHTKVHGEPLPNRTCKGCDTEFYDPKARRTYCDDCDPNAGEHNGNWKDAKESAECEICGTDFEYYPSNKKGEFCPECVREADEFLGTSSHELRDIELIERDCKHCGTSMTVLPSTDAQGYGKFCDRDCLSSWLSDQWGDGERIYNGRWREVRRRALNRDDHECQRCGKTKADIGREPDVHHITPVRDFGDSQDAHRLDNVVCLCRSCHRLVEIDKVPTPTLGETESDT